MNILQCTTLHHQPDTGTPQLAQALPTHLAMTLPLVVDRVKQQLIPKLTHT